MVLIQMGLFQNCSRSPHQLTKMSATAELNFIQNSLIFSFKKLLSITACFVKSNGFNVNFVLATVYQVSDYRLLEASGFKQKRRRTPSPTLARTSCNVGFSTINKIYQLTENFLKYVLSNARANRLELFSGKLFTRNTQINVWYA